MSIPENSVSGCSRCTHRKTLRRPVKKQSDEKLRLTKRCDTSSRRTEAAILRNHRRRCYRAELKSLPRMETGRAKIRYTRDDMWMHKVNLPVCNNLLGPPTSMRYSQHATRTEQLSQTYSARPLTIQPYYLPFSCGIYANFLVASPSTVARPAADDRARRSS